MNGDEVPKEDKKISIKFKEAPLNQAFSGEVSGI